MQVGEEIFIARIIGAPVFDPNAEKVGKVNDVVLILSDKIGSKAVGLVVEVTAPNKRRIFVPFSRVTSISASHNSSQVVITGLLNMRRFQKREIETLLKLEVLDREVTVQKTEGNWVIDDVSILLTNSRGSKEWGIGRLFVRKLEKRGLTNLLKKKTETKFISFEDSNLLNNSTLKNFSEKVIEEIEEMKPADAADVILELDDLSQEQVAKELDNETLADVLEEMPETDQLQILSKFEKERVADVLEEMEPDDAADLLGKMDKSEAEEILEEMNEDEADDVRQLLSYDSLSAGGLMTTTPIILEPTATVAFALAQIRRAELSPSLASMVFVCIPPLETPTGQFIGVLHFQQLLRHPPHTELSTIVDADVRTLVPENNLGVVARAFATYDAFMMPVIDSEKHLLGAISIDDLVDHMLPEDWRDVKDEIDEADEGIR